MSRIDWGRRTGDEVETVVGILLCRRFRRVERVKPSQGDDGLDVILREPDGWTIWQVKKYADQPSSHQRAKIKKSYERALSFVRREGVTLKAWNLVMPVDPTPPSLEWFRGITAESPAPCSWLGEDFLDSLAAEFPDVIDYYFRDGKERLAAAVADFAAMSHIRAGLGEQIQPADAMESLQSAHHLVNQLDPHFNYDFAVDTDWPNIVAEQPGLVFASVVGREGCFVTIRVLEKYHDSIDDRPIHGEGVFHTPDEESRQAVRDFFDYGAPLELASATMSADLPGGLDGSERTGSISIVARESLDRDPTFLRFRIAGDGFDDLATVRMQVEPVTTGADGENWRAVAFESPGKSFSIEQRFTDSDGMMKISFELEEISGKSPSLILPGLRFIRELKPGRRIDVGREFGPMTNVKYPIDKDLSGLVSTSILVLVEAIETIQSVTTEQLVVPDLDTLTVEDARNIETAARLIRGEAVGVYSSRIGLIADSAAVTEGDHAVFFTNEHYVGVGDRTVSIGIVSFHSPAAAIRVERDDRGEPLRATLGPVDGSDAIHGELRRVGEPEGQMGGLDTPHR